MDNSEKYKKTFIDSLSIDVSLFNENIKYNEVPEWDSIGHMTLISNLETAFKITMETDDVTGFSSFVEGKKILEKYKITF